jgi:hypothetical protein
VFNWDNLYRSLYFFLSPPLTAVRRALGQQLGDTAIKCPAFIPHHVALWLTFGLAQKRWSVSALWASWEQFGDFS